MNRSIIDLMCCEGFANAMLERCNAQIKVNTLSFCSFLPILLTSFLVERPSTFAYLITGISLMIHQVLDIANKKQAYRLQTFSFGTFYFDHMCDSFSSMLIVYIMGTLFCIKHNWLWLAIFAFSMLPFYIHHLTMYYTEYMCFPSFSPASEGTFHLTLRTPNSLNRMFHWSLLANLAFP